MKAHLSLLFTLLPQAKKVNKGKRDGTWQITEK
jgi:hypothetical protein